MKIVTQSKNWLDHQLGRVSMYRLVVIVLAVIALAGTLLSLGGTMPFTVVDALITLPVLIIVVCGLSWLLGKAVGVGAHVDSSLVTALLLFLIFWPSAEPSALLSLVFAAVLAALSKFLVTWRGRHIFNPAAFGAVVVGLVSPLLPFMFPNVATWWVATGALFPLVLIAAALVIYRTNRWALFSVYVGVALVIVVVRLVSGGNGFLDALSTGLLAYPIVFAAGFMVSEPLTLPPLKWQQMTVAALMSLVAFVPFPANPVITNTPELGIVIGNLVAFAMNARGAVKLRYLGSEDRGHEGKSFIFEPLRPLPFKAGQFAELHVAHRADSRGPRRVFSIASAPGEDTVRFGMRVGAQSSSFKNSMNALSEGTLLRAVGVWGDFQLPRQGSPKVLLLARGVGITPFLSHLLWLAREGRGHDVLLIMFANYAADIEWLREVAEADAASPRPVRVQVRVYGPPRESMPSWFPQDWVYEVYEESRGDADAVPWFNVDSLRETLPDLAARRTYVSGSPDFVNTMAPTARRAGAKRVHRDEFFGY